MEKHLGCAPEYPLFRDKYRIWKSRFDFETTQRKLDHGEIELIWRKKHSDVTPILQDKATMAMYEEARELVQVWRCSRMALLLFWCCCCWAWCSRKYHCRRRRCIWGSR